MQHFDNNCGFSSLYNCTGPVAWTSYDELTTDVAGRVTKGQTYLRINGQWDLRSTSLYNAQEQLSTVRRYDARDIQTLIQTLTYDTRGNVVAVRE